MNEANQGAVAQSVSPWDHALDILRHGRPNKTAVDLKGALLAGMDLTGIDFKGCSLVGADLTEANMEGCDFSGCDLSGAIMTGAHMDNARFVGAKLIGVDATACSARQVALGRADLTDANLFQGNFEYASFHGATAKGVNFAAANLQNTRLHGIDLRNASFHRTQLRGADLNQSHVACADFSHCDLRETRLGGLRGFESARWIGADIRDIDWSGARILGRYIRDENYLFELQGRSKMAKVVYWLWLITSDCGRSLSRWILWNVTVAVLFAMLYVHVDMNWGAHTSMLSPLYFSFVTLTTLGYGDVTPISGYAELASIAEVLLGYLGLGGLLSILANKMARRAD